MSYTITVTETKRVLRSHDEYEPIADTGNPKDNGRQFGYVPHDVYKDENHDIYEQTVESLDIVAVINAVNNRRTHD